MRGESRLPGKRKLLDLRWAVLGSNQWPLPCEASVSAAVRPARHTSICRMHCKCGKTTRPASPSRPFRAADHLQSEAEVAAYIEAMLEDGDARAVPVALRTVAEAVGGMGALARKTGLSRETLYRTLSKRGNPRLDTLAAILAAFGLRLTVRTRGGRGSRGRVTSARA